MRSGRTKHIIYFSICIFLVTIFQAPVVNCSNNFGQYQLLTWCLCRSERNFPFHTHDLPLGRASSMIPGRIKRHRFPVTLDPCRWCCGLQLGYKKRILSHLVQPGHSGMDPANKGRFLNYSNWKPLMMFTLLHQVTKCYAKFGVEKYAVSLAKRITLQNTTGCCILEKTKDKNLRSYLQSFQVYQSWRTTTLLQLLYTHFIKSDNYRGPSISTTVSS